MMHTNTKPATRRDGDRTPAAKARTRARRAERRFNIATRSRRAILGTEVR